MIKMMVPVSSEANFSVILQNPQVWDNRECCGLTRPSELDRSFRTLGSPFVGHLVWEIEDGEEAVDVVNALVQIWIHLGFESMSPFDFKFVKLG